MSNAAKKEYIQELRKLYFGATKEQKKAILDDCCKICGYNRKYAIRLLNSKNISTNKSRTKKRGPKKQYDHPYIAEVLTDIWTHANLPCAKRLHAIIPLWLPSYKKFIIPEEIKEKLMTISASTIDRIMAVHRPNYTKRGFSTTKPGAIIKKRIPIKTNQWDETKPGFLEVDTVAHCGSSTADTYVNTVNCVDIATGWTIQRAVWGKGQKATLEAIKDIESHLPFPIKGFDCDNGSEFLNWHLLKYMDDRKKPVQVTRSRAYHKNDNAHIENKNYTHVRQFIGYQRFDSPDIALKLNELYKSQWNEYLNFFLPSVKLVEKRRVGSKIIKVHDKPKTPAQRLIESGTLSQEQKQQLLSTFHSLDPFELYKKINIKIKKILKEVNHV